MTLTFCAASQAQESAQPAAPPRPLITQPVDESKLTTLLGNTYPLARPEFDLGTAPATLPLDRMLLVLKRSPQQEAALGKLLDDQQDKASPNYHSWLTPEEFGKQFGPTDEDLRTITGWLQSHGFRVGSTKGRTVLEFSGSASQVQEAFHTAIHKYIVNGEQHWANASDPQIPTALTPAVAGISSLNNFPRKAMNVPLGVVKRENGKEISTARSPNPLFTYQPNYQCSADDYCFDIAPYDFATIYNLLPLWNAGIDGTGVTIAISGETDIQMSDVEAFRSMFGLPANDPVFVANGPDPGIQGDESEADIDVQWSGAVAKGATIDFVISQSTETTSGVDLSAVYIVDQNLAPIMSESYGECELGLGTTGNQFYNALWQQAAAEGITVFISAGDAGSAGCDNFDARPPTPAKYGLQVSGYASTPYNVAVGGTDFNEFTDPTLYWNTTNNSMTQASALGYIPEITWDSSCTSQAFGPPNFSSSAETNCNNSRLARAVDVVGGSGGASNCTTPSGNSPTTCAGGYTRPSWQTGSGSFSGDGKRDIPDVSLFASSGWAGTAYVICQADYQGSPCPNFNPRFGGTSVSSPAFAGIMALINQKYGRQGNANYVFYKLAQKSGASCNSSASEATSCIFNDVTVGTNAGPCATGSPNCVTQTAGDSYGVMSGYNAGAGYDLATGLGSVNANNLVTKWNSVTLLPSITKLSDVTPTTITHGQAVSFTAAVTPQSGSGTPTGTISLLGPTTTNNTSQGIAGFNLTNGTVTGTTDLLPGGTYSLTAHYPGDSTYGPSDSSAVQVNVGAEASKTFPNLVTFGSNGRLTSFAATTATYGSGYYLFRVDVGDASANVSSSSGISSNCSQGKSSCPTGTVSIQAPGTVLNATSLSLNSEGFAENQSFPPGSYTISASYPGDASYSASTGTANFTVAQAPTVASAGTPVLDVQYGNFFQIGADISTTSDGIAPTGTFQFIQDSQALGSPVPVYESGGYNPNNTATPYAWADAISTTHINSIGNHTLAVQYSGDAYYASSASPVSTVVVGQALPFFNAYGWATYGQNVYVGQTVTASAQLYGSQYGAVPTGTITMFDNNSPFPGSVTYSSNQGMLVATTTYTFTTPGTHNFTATYSGDMNYLAATITVPQTLTVLGPVSVAPAGNVNIPGPGQSGSTPLTLTANEGFTGTVSLACTPDPGAKETSCGFASGSSTAPTLQVSLTGATATVTFSVTTTGPHPVARNQLADASALTGIGFGGIGLVLLPFAQRRRKLCAGAAVLLMLTLMSCGAGSNSNGGGGNTDPGTPAGTYSFSVTSTTGSGSSAVSLVTPVTVLVQ